jgi:hypothetical protein
MEEIIISLSKEALSELIEGAVRTAPNEFRRSVSLADDPKDDLLPAEEAATFLDVKLSTLYYKTHHREIPFMKSSKKNLLFS